MRALLSDKLTNLAARVAGPPDLKTLIPEIADWQREMILSVRPYTMTEPTALWATLQAVQHAIDHRIDGDFVECGVWRGGNTILAALLRKRLGGDFSIYAFDTFAGMTAPTEHDAKPGKSLDVAAKFAALEKGDHNDWCYASLEDVRRNFQTLVGDDSLKTVKGPVQETLVDQTNLPERIAVLRLDTDFYDSTKIELEVLWPRVVSGGIVMIDDYGVWAGARKAVDEYFEGQHVWLHRVDRQVRLIVKR